MAPCCLGSPSPFAFATAKISMTAVAVVGAAEAAIRLGHFMQSNSVCHRVACSCHVIYVLAAGQLLFCNWQRATVARQR